MKVCVRRVNEWDAPAMLKIYERAIAGGLSTYEREVPPLWEFVRRVDRYTYSRGWTLCDADGWCAGFAVARECFDRPDDLFYLDAEVYVAEDMRRKGVGRAALGLICDLAELGNRKAVRARFPSNGGRLAFFERCGFELLRVDENFRPGENWTVVERRFDAPAVDRPTKPFLVPAEDYEAARLARGRAIPSSTEVL